ncbi:hypothetical protein CSUB01_12457 [Colletotrichum sublineola]|uniref:Uncharacterized protein n=1 Tax=Colletotrichum sublineola TaxID=1173701 RepID=A0A066XGT9_COLSU|nr:hypothetical protein CSUB01_12457 [Colletotrichum sublineola]
MDHGGFARAPLQSHSLKNDGRHAQIFNARLEKTRVPDQGIRPVEGELRLCGSINRHGVGDRRRRHEVIGFPARVRKVSPSLPRHEPAGPAQDGHSRLLCNETGESQRGAVYDDVTNNLPGSRGSAEGEEVLVRRTFMPDLLSL